MSSPSRGAKAGRKPAGPTGIFGGTFDPVHVGHLRTAFEVFEGLGLAELRFIPCGLPPHRPPPVAPAELRLAMLRSAIAGLEGFVVDDRECRRPGPSWSVDTLASLRSEFPERPLALILGADAFLGLPTWHRWEELVELAHLVVVHRPGWELPADGPALALLASRRTGDAGELRRTPAGRIVVQEVTPLDVASSAIRALIAAGGDPRFLVPDEVRRLIIESDCYRAGSQAGGGGPGNPEEVRIRA